MSTNLLSLTCHNSYISLLVLISMVSIHLIMEMCRLILLFSLVLTNAAAFAPLGSVVGSSRCSNLCVLGAATTSTSNNDSKDAAAVVVKVDGGVVSRRVAMVIAAALAAGVTPVMAATLEKQVAALETKNLAEVNSKGAPEKHLPQVSMLGQEVQVVVPHVMDPEKPHFIEFVWLKDVKSSKVVAVKAFQATDPSPPTLMATVAAGSTIKPLLYCNLHGLWEGEPLSV